MALYDTRFGLPQAVVDYLNQGLPDIYQSITQPSITPINFDESTSSDDLNKTVAPIIQATRSEGGGGDSYSVYNPDPTRTRTSDEYNPYAYNRAMRDTKTFGQTVGPNPDLFYPSPLTGIPGAAANFLQNSLIGKGLDYLGNIMPINKRAILENELLGQGIRINDMGQIVSSGGDINTAENIMAGYNASKITADTFQKRRDMINEKMKDPVQKAAKLKALDEAEARILGTATDRANMITEQRLIEKDPSLAGPDYLRNSFNFLSAEEEDDDYDYDYDPTDRKEFFKKRDIDKKTSSKNVQKEIDRRKARDAAEAQEKSNRDAAREAAKKSAARKRKLAEDQEKSNRDAARKTATTGTTKPGTSGGSYVSRGPSYSGMGSIGSGGGGSKTSSAKSKTSSPTNVGNPCGYR